MIKPGFTLFACFADQQWFVKQAKSTQQFVRLCVEDQKRHGYLVPPRGRQLYEPDFFWDEADKLWRWADGRPYGPKLPPGAR